jgi:hypothetical protein
VTAFAKAQRCHPQHPGLRRSEGTFTFARRDRNHVPCHNHAPDRFGLNSNVGAEATTTGPTGIRRRLPRPGSITVSDAKRNGLTGDTGEKKLTDRFTLPPPQGRSGEQGGWGRP